MKIQRPKFNPEIDADLAVGVIDRNIQPLAEAGGAVGRSFEFAGVHERTAKGDALSVTVSSTKKRTTLKYKYSRDGLYHTLPEYLFHPLDRYSDTEGDKEAFLEKRAAQKKTEADAKEYFHPFDKTLNELRILFQKHLNDSVLDNDAFIIDFIIENGQLNKNNPFIRACLPAIINLRAHRGTHSLLSTALKMAFGNGLLSLSREFACVPVAIDKEECHICLDGSIDNLFCGNRFMDRTEVISVKYQTRITSQEEIETLTESVGEFRQFFRQWFLNSNQTLEIEFGDYSKPPVLNGTTSGTELYLNYNTQLLYES